MLFFDIMELKKIKGFKTKKVTIFRSILETRLSEERIELFQSFNDEYIHKSKEDFNYKAVLWAGEEPEEVTINYKDVFNELAIQAKSKAIVDFADEAISYKEFLSGFGGLLYHQILYLKENKLAPGILCTDLSLMFMLAVTYFPEEADLLGEQLLNSLVDLKHTMETNIRPMTGEYGFTSVVPLAAFLADTYEKNTLFEDIKPYCIATNPSYQKAMDNLYATDKDVVNNRVNEMVAFHLENSKLDLTLPFNYEEWQYFPIEIIALLELRLKKGLEIDFIENEFLEGFISHLGVDLPILLDSFTKRLKEKINL